LKRSPEKAKRKGVLEKGSTPCTIHGRERTTADGRSVKLVKEAKREAAKRIQKKELFNDEYEQI